MKQMLLLLALLLPLLAQEPVAAGSRVFVQDLQGYGNRMAEAIRVMNVPLLLAPNLAQADYEITVHMAPSEQSGLLRIPFRRTGSKEARLDVVDLRTKAVVFTQNCNAAGSTLQQRRAAEVCASALDRHIRQGGRRASVLREMRNAGPVTATSVRVTSQPAYAELEVDGVYWGVTPTAELTRLAEGSHVIVVRKSGYQRWEQKVELKVGESMAVNAELIEAAAVQGQSKIAGLD